MGSFFPQLRSGLQFQQTSAGILLQNPLGNTQLLLDDQEHAVCEKMDGKHSVEELEVALLSDKHFLAYQSLVYLLFRLWDRGMLYQEKEIAALFFPGQKYRTIDKALAWGRIRKLIAWRFRLQGWRPFSLGPQWLPLLTSKWTPRPSSKISIFCIFDFECGGLL